MKIEKPKGRRTYFLDIDGTLLEYTMSFEESMVAKELPALPQAKEKTQEWHCRGDMIVLTTARPESARPITELQLHTAGIVYDRLIMGLGSGVRVLVNDVRPSQPDKAVSYNVKRNVDGLTFID